jgi:DNA (cytosine-5)-methyltransferase 1
MMSQKEFLLALLQTAKGEPDEPTLFDATQPTLANNIPPAPFTFIDLFAGIGGFRIGLERVGGRCVEAIVSDSCCKPTYEPMFRKLAEIDVKTSLMSLSPLRE